MKIGPNTVVSVRFWIMDTQGQALDDSDGPVSYLHGGLDGLLPSLEEALVGHEIGFESTLHLEPADAFGDYDPLLVRVEPRALFPEPLEVGMQFEGIPSEESMVVASDSEESLEDQDDELPLFVVTDITPDQVVLDGNHPYAGMALRIKVEVLHVRAATGDEVEQGYADIEDEDDDALEQQVIALESDAKKVLH